MKIIFQRYFKFEFGQNWTYLNNKLGCSFFLLYFRNIICGNLKF